MEISKRMSAKTELNIAVKKFDEMIESQERIRDYIPSESEDKHLLHKRIFANDKNHFAKPSTRLYFIKKLFQYLTETTFEKALYFDLANKIAMVGEYCITLMYLDNHHQDEKYGVADEPSREANRLERMETEVDMFHYINTEFSGETQDKVLQTVYKLFKLYHKGMELDKEMLTYNHLIQNKPLTHQIDPEVDAYVDVEEFIQVLQMVNPHKLQKIVQQHYLRLYLTRAFLINTVFFQVFAELLIDIFGTREKKYKKLITYARMFGMAQQLVNDNCDYLPVNYQFSTLCKLPEDTFSDLRRGLVTLPIILFFQSPNTHKGKIFELYTDQSVQSSIRSAEDQQGLLNVLIENGSLGQGMSFVCALATYGEQQVQDEMGMFKEMFSFVRNNRYYKQYVNIKRELVQ